MSHSHRAARLALPLAAALVAACSGGGGGGSATPAGGGPTILAATAPDTLDFEGMPAGTVVDAVFGVLGTGPVVIRGNNPDLGSANASILFDSANPTGQDEDLGTPNQDFGGPGVGDAGRSGSPFENDRALGNVLIVAEDLVDGDGDGLIDDPDDADSMGARHVLDFAAIAPVTVYSLDLIDVEADRPFAMVEFFGVGGASLGTVMLPTVGDNGLANVDLGGVAGVFEMHVDLNGSGAVDNIVFRLDNKSSIGDTVFCDEDGDGVQGPGETGIEGVRVHLRCAGEDGVLGTADDFAATRVTDADGKYLFGGLPAGLCRVRVVRSSAPDDKVLGDCPESLALDLGFGEAFLDADFCFVTVAQVGDTVFCDDDDDGVQDPGEAGIEGVRIDLACAGPDGELGTADDVNSSTTSAADGSYLFADLAPDLCRVTVDPTTAPGGKVPGRCPQSRTLDLLPGDAVFDVDFCFIAPGEIGDTVFCDTDADGIQDPGEPGLMGVTVDLVCGGPDGMIGTPDDFVDSRVTDADGRYLFTGILPDVCEVSVDTTTVPAGKTPGDCPTRLAVSLAAGQSFLDADFCFVDPGEIGDLVFCDLDLDGLHDAGEPGIGGARIELACAGPDGVLGTADDLMDSTTTAADGSYLFTGVPPGECRATLDLSSVPDDKELGDCPPSLDVDLAPGAAALDLDFCLRTRPVTIGDTVFCDLDRDGLLDDGEPGVEGALIQLVCAGVDGMIGTDDDVFDSTTTDASGSYLFTGVPAGLCEVSLDPSSGPDDKVPGDCPGEYAVVLAPGQIYLVADFCFVIPEAGSVGDTVFCDADGDGVQGAGEPGIEGVAIELRCEGPDGTFGTDDDVLASTTTNADGNYLFEDVPAGRCRVRADETTAPADKRPGPCPLSLTVDVPAGGAQLDADFCFVNAPADLGGNVYCDLDNDGVRDGGEPGIPGVTVSATCGGPDGVVGTDDDVVATTTTDGGGDYLFEDLPPGRCLVRVDTTTAGDDKVPGMCPIKETVLLRPDEIVLGFDFCFVTVARIGDTVFCDLDDDGMQSPDEPGLGGVRVVLTCAGADGILGTGDDLQDERITDADGHYLFSRVPPGACEVAVDPDSAPPGKELGGCPPSLTLDVRPDDDVMGADFCFRDTTTKIRGKVFCDLDGDGHRDPDEPGIADVVIDVVCAGDDGELRTDDDILDWITTDADGCFELAGLEPQLCVFEITPGTLPPDKELGSCPEQYTVHLQPGQCFEGDFCAREVGGGGNDDDDDGDDDDGGGGDHDDDDDGGGSDDDDGGSDDDDGGGSDDDDDGGSDDDDQGNDDD